MRRCVQRDSKSAFWIALQLGSPTSAAATLTHAWPSDRLATVPADFATDQAPSIAPPVRVPLVALATKLFRISRKHHLNGCSPSLKTQSVEAAVETPQVPRSPKPQATAGGGGGRVLGQAQHSGELAPLVQAEDLSFPKIISARSDSAIRTGLARLR